MRLTDFESLVFDCDGVILDSNNVKTRAFYEAALPYGEQAAQQLVQHHTENGGILRYHKFRYFLDHLAPKGVQGPSLETLLSHYAMAVSEGLLACDSASGLATLREQNPRASWSVVSGGDQQELRLVFKKRQLSGFFDGGIFGSPDSKHDILQREILNGQIKKPGLFIGDSRYDYEAATDRGLSFVFLSQWTEFKDSEDYFKNKNVLITSNLQSLLDYA